MCILIKIDHLKIALGGTLEKIQTENKTFLSVALNRIVALRLFTIKLNRIKCEIMLSMSIIALMMTSNSSVVHVSTSEGDYPSANYSNVHVRASTAVTSAEKRVRRVSGLGIHHITERERAHTLILNFS